MSKQVAVRAPKQKRAKERVRVILEASRAVLLEEGIKHFTTNSIARRGGFPVSSIYQYFPNKEAVLVALYSQYLAEIRESYVALDAGVEKVLPWQDYCLLLIRTIADVETQDNIDEQFEIALELYPELEAVDREHEEWLANRLADDMRRLGSTWPRAKLKRLAHLFYEYYGAIWHYRSRHKPPKKELEEWMETTFLALAARCFEE